MFATSTCGFTSTGPTTPTWAIENGGTVTNTVSGVVVPFVPATVIWYVCEVVWSRFTTPTFSRYWSLRFTPRIDNCPCVSTVGTCAENVCDVVPTGLDPGWFVQMRTVA